MVRHRRPEIGAALRRWIGGDDHALSPADPPDAGDDAGGGGAGAVHAVGGELADLQERAARVQQAMNPVAGSACQTRGRRSRAGSISATTAGFLWVAGRPASPTLAVRMSKSISMAAMGERKSVV